MKKVYVTNPQFAIPDPVSVLLCYSILEWDEALPPLLHPPCNEETIVTVAFGDTANEIKTKIVDNIVARITGITSNDIVFIPQLGTGA